jgi:hypothetical protein
VILEMAHVEKLPSWFGGDRCEVIKELTTRQPLATWLSNYSTLKFFAGFASGCKSKDSSEISQLAQSISFSTLPRYLLYTRFSGTILILSKSSVPAHCSAGDAPIIPWESQKTDRFFNPIRSLSAQK